MKKSRLFFLVAFGLVLALAIMLSAATPALAVAPTVTSATPNQGDQGETLSVAIAGAGFTGATAVDFGAGIAVNGFTVDSDTQVTADITIDAAAILGARDVSVTNIDGTGTLISGFTVDQAPPAITSVSPDQGTQGETLNVTVGGSYLTGTTAVDFGSGITTNSFVVTPLGGSSEVQVGTGTAAVTYPFHTWYCDTRTQSILLASEIGQSGEIQKLRVYCSTRPGQDLTNFYIRMQHTAMASFSGNSFVNSGWTTVLYATNVDKDVWTVPGWVEFEFTTPFDYDGLSNLLIDYCVDNSYYTSNGACYSTTATSRTIYAYSDLTSGNLLNRASGTLASWYNNVILVMENMDTIDANITIDGAATPGYRDVSVTTPEGTGTAANGFAVLALPALTSASPDNAAQGQTLDVTITGTELLGVTSVGFGSGVTINSFSVDNATQITAGITVSGSATVGARDVTVTNAAGTATLTNGFTVNQAPPTVTSVNPNQGLQGQTLAVTIWGSYFTGASAVSFGPGIAVNSYNVNSSVQIVANVTINGAAAPGLRDVSVTTPGGTGSLSNAFAVLALPIVDTITPAYGVQGETLDVVIAGSNLLGVTAVSFGVETTVTSITIDSDTQITVRVRISDTSPIVTRNVNVINPAGTAVKVNAFTVLAMPTITEVNPSQAAQGQTINVVLTGTYLLEATSVSFGYGVDVNSFNVDNATQITASVTVSASATPGYRDVSVTTLGATATKAQSFGVFAPPTIATISPSQGIQGQTVTFIMTGTHLIGTTSVDLGADITVTSFNVDSDTQLRATTVIGGSAASGPRDVSVTTPGGTATKEDGFTVLLRPTIESVTPSRGIQGQTIDVTIGGDCFTNASSISFGPGITVNDFTVNNSREIVVNITVGVNATVGTRTISITTPVATGTLAEGFAVVVPCPEIETLTPALGRQGQKLEVVITGRNFAEATAVTFGTGVTVDSFTVDSGTQITVQIAIDGDAVVSMRDVSISTPEATGTAANVFEIQPKSVGVPMYFWLLAGILAAAGLLGLAFVIRKKRAAAR